MKVQLYMNFASCFQTTWFGYVPVSEGYFTNLKISAEERELAIFWKPTKRIYKTHDW